MSPAFINGKTGTVLNVYTCPDYRHKGYARLIMEAGYSCTEIEFDLVLRK